MIKKFMLEIPDELHKVLKMSALKKGETMQSYIKKAVEQRLKKEGEINGER